MGLGGTTTAVCEGMLVLHGDHTVAACTCELEGLPCAGADAPHLDTIACEDLLGDGGCEHCAMDSWGDAAWRHAARVGRMATRQRCALHRPRRAPVSC